MAISERGALRATAVLLTGVSAFQACLAFGAPWGRIAYGGSHDGRLPGAHRRVSGVAALAYATTAGFLASETGSHRVRRSVLSTVMTFMTLSTGLNLASRSLAERLVWTPVCALTAVLAWRARPR